MTRAVLPIDVARIQSHQPCESCGYRRSTFRARLDPPGSARREFRLCDQCIEGLRL